jgi:hypothetical protein
VREVRAAGVDAPWGAGRRVRRAVVAGAREELRDQDQQDDLAGRLSVRAGAPARTQGHDQQGGEFAPHRPLAYGTMRAGLFLAYWPWFSLEEQVELAVLADELELDSVWISEAWGQDAVSVLGLLAGRTRPDIDVAAAAALAVDDDVARARDAVRPWLAFYLGAMGSREKNFYVELAGAVGG